MTRLIDSHCHLDFDGLANRLPEVLAAMDTNGIAGCMTIGVTLEEAPQVLAIARAHEQVFASVGVHPEYADHQEPDVATLCSLADDAKVLAIGETGLDYHWHKDQPEWQRERFRVHIRAARELKKPLVIHTREASADTLRILKEEGADSVGGILHCFTESLDVARAGIDLGFYISLSGIVSFKKAEQVHEVARSIPLDRLLVETDAPIWRQCRIGVNQMSRLTLSTWQRQLQTSARFLWKRSLWPAAGIFCGFSRQRPLYWNRGFLHEEVDPVDLQSGDGKHRLCCRQRRQYGSCGQGR